MSTVLLFTLYAPLASWGEIAVGETRGSWDRPSRSAILGVVAAALGITRDAQEMHDALDRGYGVGVRLNAAGTQLTDYHTTQVVSASAASRRGVRTRAQLLAAAKPSTILSRRMYRQDAIATVSLWARPNARWSLAELAGALRHPVFTLYAGRKSNPFGLPLAPEALQASTLAEAFLRRAEADSARRGIAASVHVVVQDTWNVLRPRGGWGREIAHDHWDDGETGLIPVRREIRRDMAPHRVRWIFAERVVEIGLLPESIPVESGP